MKHAAVFVVTEFNNAGPDHTPVACGDRTIYVRAEQVETEVDDENTTGADSLELAYQLKRPGEHLSNTTPFDVPPADEQPVPEAPTVPEPGTVKGKKKAKKDS